MTDTPLLLPRGPGVLGLLIDLQKEKLANGHEVKVTCTSSVQEARYQGRNIPRVTGQSTCYFEACDDKARQSNSRSMQVTDAAVCDLH